MSAHSAKQCVIPSAVISRLTDVLRACSWDVAHRQLSFEYGPLEFFLSMECLDDGLRPMSRRKSPNEIHSTLTPLPPYRCQSLFAGLLQRWSILRKMAYSTLSDSPCISLVAHPQLLDMPLRSALPATSTCFPQEHRHSQYVSFFFGSAGARTNQLVNV